jgi:predicted RNA-binding protein YlqC (UPF0109 family)
MKELLEYIARNLVDYPDDVRVEQKGNEDSIVLELHVHESDMGKVIGRQGRIAKSIRSVMKAAASKNNVKVSVDIV